MPCGSVGNSVVGLANCPRVSRTEAAQFLMGNASSLLAGARATPSASVPPSTATASTSTAFSSSTKPPPVAASILEEAEVAPSILAEAAINILAEAASLSRSLAATAEGSSASVAAPVKKGGFKGKRKKKFSRHVGTRAEQKTLKAASLSSEVANPLITGNTVNTVPSRAAKRKPTKRQLEQDAAREKREKEREKSEKEKAMSAKDRAEKQTAKESKKCIDFSAALVVSRRQTRQANRNTVSMEKKLGVTEQKYEKELDDNDAHFKVGTVLSSCFVNCITYSHSVSTPSLNLYLRLHKRKQMPSTRKNWIEGRYVL